MLDVYRVEVPTFGGSAYYWVVAEGDDFRETFTTKLAAERYAVRETLRKLWRENTRKAEAGDPNFVNPEARVQWCDVIAALPWAADRRFDSDFGRMVAVEIKKIRKESDSFLDRGGNSD